MPLTTKRFKFFLLQYQSKMYTYQIGAGESYLDHNGDFTINVGGVNVLIDEEANSAKVMYFIPKFPIQPILVLSSFKIE